MRVLLLLRGSPGCGKTTWIEKNSLTPYALSADDIRVMCASPEMTVDGSSQISQKNDKTVWDMLFRLLEIRMQKGEFTVIDATNSKTSEMKRYKDLCQTYRYRIYLVDFTSMPMKEAMRRNAEREEAKRVPDSVIQKMYARFATQKVPSGITVIQPEELGRIWMKPIDYSCWKTVHIIGDIHGCKSALNQAFKQDEGGDPVLADDEMYVFVGDYLDRGIQNAETLNFLLNIYTKPNVLLLEGNHERHLFEWAEGETSLSKEFEFKTRPQLEAAGIDKKEARQFYRKLAQCAWFRYGGGEYLVTHGGISRIPENLTLLSTYQMIAGVGSYDEADKTDNAFAEFMPENVFSVHGHRNVKKLPADPAARTFNLEGGVEFGGELRVLDLYPDGAKEIRTIRNSVYEPPEEKKEAEDGTVGDAVLSMRKNKFIQEKSFGNISSFNFTKAAFYGKVWDGQTVKARGLYINIPEQKVAARAYNKFFNINERDDTKFEVLSSKLTFPVTAYVKENGYLGIAAYNSDTDSLFVTTKSDPDGPYADWLREMLVKKVSPENIARMTKFSKDHNVSFVFECVDMTNDPHVIEYDGDRLFLLDVVYNTLDFKKFPYDELRKVSEMFGLQTKEKAFVIGSWPEFCDWYREVLEEDYLYHGREIEGFVIEDAAGYMLKLKLTYYNFWKFMRSIAHKTIKCGAIPGKMTAALSSPESNMFYAWVRDHEDREHLPTDICTLRRMFFEDRQKVKQDA